MPTSSTATEVQARPRRASHWLTKALTATKTATKASTVTLFTSSLSRYCAKITLIRPVRTTFSSSARSKSLSVALTVRYSSAPRHSGGSGSALRLGRRSPGGALRVTIQ